MYATAGGGMKGGERQLHSHQASPGSACGAVAGGPEVRRKVSLLPSPLEGDRTSVSPGNRDGDVGSVVTVRSGARECCPRPAISPGSQHRALPGPVRASWTARSCLCHLGPFKDTLAASVSPVCLPQKSGCEGKGDIDDERSPSGTVPGGLATEPLSHG